MSGCAVTPMFTTVRGKRPQNKGRNQRSPPPPKNRFPRSPATGSAALVHCFCGVSRSAPGSMGMRNTGLEEMSTVYRPPPIRKVIRPATPPHFSNFAVCIITHIIAS